MGLSVNPLYLVETFLKGRYRNRDQVADYLDQVAIEAQALADVWDKVISELLCNEVFVLDRKTEQIIDGYHYDNAGPFSSLCYFYQQFTTATEGKVSEEWRNTIMNHLGALLRERNITLETYREALLNVKHSAFISPDNASDDFRDLSRLSMALHREAAALGVLAKSFRVAQG